MNSLKRGLFYIFYAYEKHFPIQRGKFFLSRIITYLTGTVTVHTRDMIWLSIFPSSAMDKSYLNKSDESHLLIRNELNALQKGDVFVDIGANIGYFSFYAAKIVGPAGKVFSFEPSVREYNRLITGIKLNQLNNIVPFNFALSNENAMLSMEIDPFHTGLNKTKRNTDQSSVLIPAYRGEHLIPKVKIKLAKIDVEGAEMKVLQGMENLLKEGWIEKLIVEITPDFLTQFDNSKEELYAFMLDCNYRPTINATEWQYDEVFIKIEGTRA